MTVHDDDDDDDNSSEDDVQSVRQSLNCLTNKPTNRHDFQGCCEPHYESKAKCKAFYMKIVCI